jgi:hypothetical protein
MEVFFKGAIDKGYDFTTPKFAEGGLVQKYNQGGLVPMDEQMSQFNDEKIDPVSGNEVPPGSLPEEVRDDVDAKLSEGEYVVPADVVRYFGVGYFEKLRDKAKKALAEMDSDGRIGGEPVQEIEDDLPFSDDELMTLDEEVGPVQMAEGGVVAQGFNPADFSAGFSSQGSGVQTKTFINKEGQQRSIMFVNGRPIQQIPAGFVEATAENRAELTKKQTADTMPAGEVATEFSGGEGGFDGSSSGETSGTTGGIGKDIGTPEGGYGKMGTGATVGLGALAGLAFGGIKGAIAGGKEGKDIANFNDARNSLVEAVQSNDLSAIGKASKEVEDTFEQLGKIGKVATNTLGMSARDAINAVGYGAQGAGTSSRGEFGYGLSEGEQAAASNSFAGMDESDPGYADPYGEGFGPGGANAGDFGGAEGADVAAAGGLYAKGGLVKKTAQTKPKPEGKGLVKRKPKNK